MPRCTSRLSSICCPDGRYGSRRYQPDDGRIVAAPSGPPRHTPLRHLRHSDEQWPSTLEVSKVTAGLVRIDDGELDPYTLTSSRSCLLRSRNAAVVVAAAVVAVAVAVAVCPVAIPTTAASSPNDSLPGSQPQ